MVCLLDDVARRVVGVVRLMQNASHSINHGRIRHDEAKRTTCRTITVNGYSDCIVAYFVAAHCCCELQILLLRWAGLQIQPNDNSKGKPNISYDRLAFTMPLPTSIRVTTLAILQAPSSNHVSKGLST